MKDNHSIVLVSTIHQHGSAIGIYICLLPLEPPSHHPPLYIVPEPRVELLASYLKFPLAVYFIHVGIYVSMLELPNV